MRTTRPKCVASGFATIGGKEHQGAILLASVGGGLLIIAFYFPEALNQGPFTLAEWLRREGMILTVSLLLGFVGYAVTLAVVGLTAVMSGKGISFWVMHKAALAVGVGAFALVELYRVPFLFHRPSDTTAVLGIILGFAGLLLAVVVAIRLVRGSVFRPGAGKRLYSLVTRASMLAGTAFCLIGMGEAIYFPYFRSHALRASGVVTDLIREEDGGNIYLCPQFSFRTTDGHGYQTTSTTCNDPSISAGQAVVIFYKPRNPMNAYIDSPTQFSGVASGNLKVGTVTLLIAISLFWYARRNGIPIKWLDGKPAMTAPTG